jgi:hypothetical protein
MAWGEGADWEIKPEPVEPSGETVLFDLKVSSPGQSPATQTDVVQMQITGDDTPVTAAMKLAQEWNTQRHIEEVTAKAVEGQHLTLFLLTGDLASSTIAEMAITFPGQERKVMSPGEAVEWAAGPFQVTRVLVDVSWPTKSR